MSILEVDTPPPPSDILLAKKSVKKGGSKFPIYIALSIMIFILSAGGAYFLGNKTADNIPNEESILKEVSELIEIPPEKPIIATVTEKDISTKSTFFVNSKIGDKVLIFTSSRKAILYRPSEKKVIEVGSITETKQLPSPTPTILHTPTTTPISETLEKDT